MIPEKVNNKEKFTITLKDVGFYMNNDFYEVKGKFNIDINTKNKDSNTKVLDISNKFVECKEMKTEIVQIIQNKFQTMIKTRTTIKNPKKNEFNMYETKNEFDQPLDCTNIKTLYRYYYSDGKVEESTDEDIKEYDGYIKYEIEEIFVLAKEETKIKIDMIYEAPYEIDSDDSIEKGHELIRYGIFEIDPEKLTIDVNNEYEIISNDYFTYYKNTNFIENFDINFNDDSMLMNQVNCSNEFISAYEFDFDDHDKAFLLVEYRDKSLLDSYDFEYGDGNSINIKIFEDDNSIVIVRPCNEENKNKVEKLVKNIKYKEKQ